MDVRKMSKEELELLSNKDITFYLLEGSKNSINTADLFKEIIKIKTDASIIKATRPIDIERIRVPRDISLRETDDRSLPSWTNTCWKIGSTLVKRTMRMKSMRMIIIRG